METGSLEGSATAQTAQPHAEALYTAQALRDPFESLLPRAPSSGHGASEPIQAGGQQPQAAGAQPMAPAPIAPPNLRIQGIVWGNAQPQAIINNTVYGVNDVVEGATIVAIDRGGITVDHQGARVSYTVTSVSRTDSLSHQARQGR